MMESSKLYLGSPRALVTTAVTGGDGLSVGGKVGKTVRGTNKMFLHIYFYGRAAADRL